MSEARIATFECVLRAWQAHEKELLAFLLHRSTDSHAAEDLLQEVFIKSMRQGKGFCLLENPRAWLFKVARNALIDSVRSAKPVVPLSDDVIDTSSSGELAPVDELDACLARNLLELDATDRGIIQACDLDRLTVRAYAEANELKLATAKSRLLCAGNGYEVTWSATAKCVLTKLATFAAMCHAIRGEFFSALVLEGDSDQTQGLLEKAREYLHERFEIRHVKLQVETADQAALCPSINCS